MKMQMIDDRVVLDKPFHVFGTVENPMFLAKDVALWIEHSNSRAMIQKVDEDEKVCVNNPYAIKGQKEQWFLTENGVYEVLMQSRKPIAKVFKKKVKEILKTIRKTGGYVADDQMFIDTYLPLADENTKALFKATLFAMKEQSKMISEMKPKADTFDLISENGALSMSDVAKIIGNPKYGAKTLFRLLRDNEYLMSNNAPFSEYIEQGLFVLRENVCVLNNGTKRRFYTTCVTEKGIEKIKELIG